MKKPTLTHCVTLKFKIALLATFLDTMADTFAYSTYKMTVDATTTIISVKITCDSSLAEILLEELEGFNCTVTSK
jgi:hypothetical protein